jgi:serpin B
MRSVALHTLPFALLAAACTLNGQSFDVVQSDVPRDTSPSVSSADAAQLAKDDTAFAMDLYARVAPDDSQNVFFSPYSISLALAMTYNGAAGDTAQQMANALHFSLPVDRLNAALDSVDLALATRKNALDAAGHPVKGFELNVADSLWADKTLPIAQPFVDTLGRSYGAALRLVDFIDAPDPARVAINGWVSDQTNAKIQDLIPQGDIDSSTRMVLVNAIYFDAPWESPFSPDATQQGTFTRADGSTTTDTAMYQYMENASYGQGDGWQAVELPYVGNQTSMVVVVPDSGKLASVEQSLNGDGVQSVFSSLAAGATVSLTLPKFQIKGATISLAKELRDLGMVDAFDSEKANFSKMADMPLYVSDVVHQAFVNVDEAGTEAAAATAVVMAGAAAPDKLITLDVNRPFLIFIRDIPTNTVLFVGRVVDPT